MEDSSHQMSWLIMMWHHKHPKKSERAQERHAQPRRDKVSAGKLMMTQQKITEPHDGGSSASSTSGNQVDGLPLAPSFTFSIRHRIS